MIKHTLSFICILLFFACSSKKDLIYEAPIPDYNEELLDTLVVSAPRPGSEKEYELPVYNESYNRTHDLIHTHLDIRFDWEKQYVLGKAKLELKPLFYPTDKLRLDAKGFDIHEIKLLSGEKVDYNYDGYNLWITFSREYKKDESFTVLINYTAKPNEGPIGGSDAITSDKGLFFINPTNSNPNKPQQIWTQGETENNSRWFPTIDKPNERCTQEIHLTVQERFTTLSNGILMSSRSNNDGTRTDYWKQDKGHTPYLFMVAVGEYAVVKDRWKNIPVDYYVEEEYKNDAKKIFNHTPEMIGYFSDVLDYDYPWDKYSSVVCRDYVSGAMENTTAVVFGQFVQRTARELIDSDNDYIVAHELFHHWFGDLVTCESWANLTLNEGFANYSEYLWFEHKYGKDRAEEHRMNELRSYIYSYQQTGGHPLIHYGYEDKEDMFDAHSYNKGGLVLHMLRNIVGDEAFFAALNKYLVDNAFSAVETDELRLAFEDITGLDLNWFFDQWYFGTGHPELSVSYEYIDTELHVTVEQTQDPESAVPVFVFPVVISVYDQLGSVQNTNVRVDKRKQKFVFNCPNPSAIVFDGEQTMLMDLKEEKSSELWENQYRFSPYFRDRIDALLNLRGSSPKTFISALDDPYHSLRIRGLRELDLTQQSELTTKVADMVKSDVHSGVRSSALNLLNKSNYEDISSLAKHVIANDEAYPCISRALKIIHELDPDKSIFLADSLKDERSSLLQSAIIDIYLDSGNENHIPYVEQTLIDGSIFEIFPVITKYTQLMKKQEPHSVVASIERIKSIPLDKNEDSMKKFVIAKNISNLKNHLNSTSEGREEYLGAVEKLEGILKEIIENENDKNLQSRYKGL